jgi:threonine dehydratase
MTLEIARQVVDEMVLVSEDEIAAAVKAAFHELHLAFEGSAVVGIAALLNGRMCNIAGKRVAVVITGRNIAAEQLCTLLR